MFRKRRTNGDDTLARLRLLSAECSDAGVEEADESQVEQAVASPKEFCEKCHLSFGSAEPRVAVALGKVMHQDCYVKHLHGLKQRSDRIHAFTTRNVH